MEPYRNNNRGSYNRNMTDRCNQGRPSPYQGRMPINQSRPVEDSCPVCMPRVLPVDNNCDCKDDNPHMRHFSVGIGYVPMQEWGELYDMEKGFVEGTIFPELNLIFCGVRGRM